MGRINLVWQSSVHAACVHSKVWLRSYMKSQRSYYTMSDNEWEEIKWKQCVTYFESLPRGEVWLLDWDFSLRIMEKDRKCIYVKVIRNLLYLNKELYHLYMEESTDVKNHLNDHFLVIKHGSQDWGESTPFFVTSLPPLYDTMVITVLVGKETLKLEEAQQLCWNQRSSRRQWKF